MLVVVLAVTATGHAVELARIEGIEIEQIDSRIFALDQPEELSIRAVTFRTDRFGGQCMAWIINSLTREPVWTSAEASVSRRRSLVTILRDTIELPAGEYELYYATHMEPERHQGFLDWLDDLFGSGDLEPEEIADELGITVEAANGHMRGVNLPGRVRQVVGKGAVVALTAVGDNQSLHQAFALSRSTELEIYALGEADRRGTYDRAWIIDTDTGEWVWELDYHDSESAGGADRNRRVRTTLTLPTGRYAAFYTTDGSHSWPFFRDEPPRDPMAWGITIRTADPAHAARATAVEYQDPLEQNLIVDLTRVGNDEHVVKAFTLKQPVMVKVFAIGEGDSRQLFDYGWINNARTREAVWMMEPGATEHAGGAGKNRLAIQMFQLDAGSYQVHYVTDDSHAFQHWNASPPLLPERWGVTVVGVGDGFSPDQVEPYKLLEDPYLIAAITRVGNDEHESKRFNLGQDQDILIYALGEGADGTMYDYGWIEDRQGRVIWEMSFQMTVHAGGVSKNRLFRGRLPLPAGEYELHFQSDGSHAYRSWNGARPHDPESWGITIIRAEQWGASP
jgi:hypothetical protein